MHKVLYIRVVYSILSAVCDGLLKEEEEEKKEEGENHRGVFGRRRAAFSGVRGDVTNCDETTIQVTR